MTLTKQERDATIEALKYYLQRWPNEENRPAMLSALMKLTEAE